MPTLMISIVDCIVVFLQSNEISILIEDNLLKASAKVISQQIRYFDNQPEANFSPAAIELLANDFHDKVYYSVTNSHHFLISGDSALPSSPDVNTNNVETSYFFKINQKTFRVLSYFYKIPNSDNDYIITNVAKTLGSFQHLRNQIFWNTLRQHLVFLFIIILTLSFTFLWTIRPINDLAKILLSRKDKSLEPISLISLPQELMPILNSLNTYIKKLNDHICSQESFIHNAAHHFRTSYATLNVELDLAIRSSSEENHPIKFFHHLKSAVESDIKMVNDLLLLATIENQSNKMENDSFPKAVIYLENLTVKVIERLAPLAYKKGINFNVDISNDHIHFNGNVALVEVLISNLIENAIMHTPTGSKVEIKILRTSTKGVLSICDNGDGIPITELENVFKRFYKLKKNHSTGTGLGLAIVKEIAELTNIEIKIFNSPHHTGLCVELYFLNLH